MSKDLLRLLVVVILIAGITTAVYFILNQPDKTRKQYNNFISQTQTEEYQNYSYLTKEWQLENALSPTSLALNNPNIAKHIQMCDALKLQVEENLLLLKYAQKRDETAQKSLQSKIDAYNEKAYGKNGVTYQAKYLYNYYVNEYDINNLPALTQQLLATMHEMEKSATELLAELTTYVQKNVFSGNRPNDFKYVLNDFYSLIASATTSYENSGSMDELYKNYGNYSNYIAGIEYLIELAQQNGYHTLGINGFVVVYNQTERAIVLEMLKAQDKAKFINDQTDETLKANLTTIYNLLEVA